jgi:hypothetical protein
MVKLIGGVSLPVEERMLRIESNEKTSMVGGVVGPHWFVSQRFRYAEDTDMSI